MSVQANCSSGLMRACRPTRNPRWYLVNRPRTASGVRAGPAGTGVGRTRPSAPDTRCARGRRLGNPALVNSWSTRVRRACAARHPSSNGDRHCDTMLGDTMLGDTILGDTIVGEAMVDGWLLTAED